MWLHPSSLGAGILSTQANASTLQRGTWRGVNEPRHVVVLTQLRSAASKVKASKSPVQCCSDASYGSTHSRRSLIALTAALICTSSCPDLPATAEAIAAEQKQLARGNSLVSLLEKDAKVQNPGVGWALTKKGKQLFYPDWLEGTWQAEARLQAVSFPRGQRFIDRNTPGVTKASMLAAFPDVGAAMEQPLGLQMRFVPSPDGSGIIADWPFNLHELVSHFLGPGYDTLSVSYDPVDDPTRLSMTYRTPRRDTRAQAADNRKAELFLNNSRSDIIGEDRFVAAQMIRQVIQAKQQGSVGDYEVISEFQRQTPGRVFMRQRAAAFLQPQDALFFDSNGSAVAVYDYNFELTKQ